ncbi:MAG: hypothetical protein QOF33_4987 [Thermomicrobiales bacterium]|nr:hypothetical protein [Thermomicrobiales bacterium]MEA2594110.1 hypothetical protein [Thermomicrobiales bacterium]
MRAGICGAGFVAQAHAHRYASQPGIELAAVVHPRLEHAEQLAACYGATATTEFDTLLGADRPTGVAFARRRRGDVD